MSFVSTYFIITKKIFLVLFLNNSYHVSNSVHYIWKWKLVYVLDVHIYLLCYLFQLLENRVVNTIAYK